MHKLDFKNLKSSSFADIQSSRQPENEDFSWWTKYYNSIKHSEYPDDSVKHSLTIFDSELENQFQYSYLNDWAAPMELIKNVGDKKIGQNSVYGKLKCSVQVRQCNNARNSCNDAFDNKYF